MTERIVHSTGMFYPQVVNETSYERCCQSLAPRLFPEYIWCDFKSEIRHPDGLVHADAALIAKDYSRWYVVEVELAWHRWETHIRPQLVKLTSGIYHNKHRQRLLALQPELDPSGMAALDIHNPEFAVIIERAPPNVRQWCRSRGILCIEADLFRSEAGDSLLAVSGDVLYDTSTVRDARLVGRMRKANYRVDVPMLVYEFPSEVSDLERPFEVQVGDDLVVANNFGRKPRGVALRCTLDVFQSSTGAAEEFDIFRISTDCYKLIPRS